MNDVNVFDYLGYNDYLKDCYAYRKSKDSWFSYQYITDKLKLSNKSQVSRIFEGKRKRLGDELVRGISELFKHSTQDALYFEKIVDLYEADNTEAKNRILQDIHRFLRQQQIRELERREYEYMRDWYNPVIREIVTTKGFNGNAKEITNLILSRLPENKVEAGLSLLKGLGLIEQKDGDEWVLKDVSLSLKQDKRKQAIRNYQKQILEMLPGSIPSDQEQFATRTITATFGFDSSQMNEILGLIEGFYNKLVGLLAEMDETKEGGLLRKSIDMA